LRTGIEIDRDDDWMTHTLQFAKDNIEEVTKAERDYEVIDPRARASRAREEAKKDGHKEKGYRKHRPKHGGRL
jgi:peptidyl-prolyl cis-trans isomerase SDCCAG10